MRGEKGPHPEGMCLNVNSKGNYTDSGSDNTREGTVTCAGFVCNVTYQDHNYTRNCKEEE